MMSRFFYALKERMLFILQNITSSLTMQQFVKFVTLRLLFIAATNLWDFCDFSQIAKISCRSNFYSQNLPCFAI